LWCAWIEYAAFAAEGGIQTVNEPASEAEVEPLIKAADDLDIREVENTMAQAETHVEDERRWPQGGKLWLNWILQALFLPLLWFGTLLAPNAYREPSPLYVTFHACSPL
jgi:hypothetical protein